MSTRKDSNAAPSSSVRRPAWSHLRQLSRTSLDKLSIESPRSPDTVSSNSTLRADGSARDDPQHQQHLHHHPHRAPHNGNGGSMRRKCTVTVNESFARDDILMNLDLFNSNFRPGMLVSIDVLKPEVGKGQSVAAKKKRLAAQDAARNLEGGVQQQTSSDKRYIFVVKDMPRELKIRYPHVEIYVAKSIADVFGMKKGSQVMLAPVRLVLLLVVLLLT